MVTGMEQHPSDVEKNLVDGTVVTRQGSSSGVVSSSQNRLVVEDDEEDESSVSPSVQQGANAAAREAVKERSTLARKETRAVKRLRVIVLLVICLTAIVVAVGVFLYTRNVETKDFERAYEAHSNRIIESFHDSVERKLAAMDALSVTYTSYAQATGASFPNVTLPDFELRGANSRILSRGLFFYWLPLVTDETRAGWEAYANQTHGHMMQSFMSEVTLRGAQDAKYNITPPSRLRRLVDEPMRFRQRIWTIMDGDGLGNTFAPENSGPYFPLWQLSPVMPMIALLNINMRDFDTIKQLSDHVLGTGNAVLGPATNLLDPNDHNNEGDDVTNFFLAHGQYRENVQEFMLDPSSPLIYPVFDSFDVVNNTRKIVGLLQASLFWRLYFQDVLPPGSDGIICHLRNPTQNFSFRVDGPSVTFLGPGDFHDPNYDSMARVADVGEYIKSRESVQTRGYTAADLDENYDRNILTVYPSATLQESYRTNNPAILTAVVALIFAFTSLVFIAYDCLVERRQHIVMDKAVKSGAIVKTLYPDAVRERLMDEAVPTEGQGQQDSIKNAWRSGGPGSLGDSLKGLDASTGGSVHNRGRPIADLYPNTTILFADIAGFTSWSAKRTPVEVFELLEALYSAFDSVATRRKVFKVETIGDCYVAVTGLPQPQPDHAVRMIRFARDALILKGTNVLSTLQSTLGEDTEQLGFRIGMHSGPVTAGVLRGDKGRFQLFGDTMNTASRMESTGMKGRIHVSQATADELTVGGKGHWATPREDKVNPKGKGEMQTYWIDVNLPGKSSVTNLSVNVSMPEDALDDDDGFCLEGGFSDGPEQPPMNTLLLPTSMRREVHFPPGALGIVVEERGGIGLVICAVESTSGVYGLCDPGDVIVKFNDVDTTKFSVAELYLLAAGAVDQNKTLTLESSTRRVSSSRLSDLPSYKHVPASGRDPTGTECREVSA